MKADMAGFLLRAANYTPPGGPTLNFLWVHTLQCHSTQDASRARVLLPDGQSTAPSGAPAGCCSGETTQSIRADVKGSWSSGPAVTAAAAESTGLSGDAQALAAGALQGLSHRSSQPRA